MKKLKKPKYRVLSIRRDEEYARLRKALITAQILQGIASPLKDTAERLGIYSEYDRFFVSLTIGRVTHTTRLLATDELDVIANIGKAVHDGWSRHNGRNRYDRKK